MAQSSIRAAKSWREVLKIHPAAELFPPLSPSERAAQTRSARRRVQIGHVDRHQGPPATGAEADVAQNRR